MESDLAFVLRAATTSPDDNAMDPALDLGSAPEEPTRKGPRTSLAIRQAAIDLFYEHGYQATTLRELASACGLKVGSVYNHIESKSALLYEIMTGIMTELLAAQTKAITSSTSSVERLQNAIKLHVAFHAHRAKEVFIGNSELRSLPPKERQEVIMFRDRYEQVILDIVEAGIAEGSFRPVDPRLAVYAILATGTQVAAWFRPNGRLSLEQIADFHTDMLTHGLLNTVAAERS
jgi:AcrR family transcriptional regulator